MNTEVIIHHRLKCGEYQYLVRYKDINKWKHYKEFNSTKVIDKYWKIIEANILKREMETFLIDFAVNQQNINSVFYIEELHILYFRATLILKNYLDTLIIITDIINCMDMSVKLIKHYDIPQQFIKIIKDKIQDILQKYTIKDDYNKKLQRYLNTILRLNK